MTPILQDQSTKEVAEGARTEETVLETLRASLNDRLERKGFRGQPDRLAEELLEIGRWCSEAPDYDRRTPDEIVGYDESGLPA